MICRKNVINLLNVFTFNLKDIVDHGPNPIHGSGSNFEKLIKRKKKKIKKVK